MGSCGADSEGVGVDSLADDEDVAPGDHARRAPWRAPLVLGLNRASSAAGASSSGTVAGLGLRHTACAACSASASGTATGSTSQQDMGEA